MKDHRLDEGPCVLRSSMRCKVSGAVCGVVLAVTSSAQAHHAATAIELLAPAFVSMQYAMVCTSLMPDFLQQTGGPRGSVLSYAEHVRDEVLAGQPKGRAEIILRGAAEQARRTALDEVGSIGAAHVGTRDVAVARWCRTGARDAIQGFIMRHDEAHDEFLMRLRDATQH